MPPMPLKQFAIDYCNNGGSTGYAGGAYATYNAWSIDCEVWTFLGLSQEQWMQVKGRPSHAHLLSLHSLPQLHHLK
jgi:hypothetical protein